MLHPSVVISVFQNINYIPHDIVGKIIDEYNTIYTNNLEMEIKWMRHEQLNNYLKKIGTPDFDDDFIKELDSVACQIQTKMKEYNAICNV